MFVTRDKLNLFVRVHARVVFPVSKQMFSQSQPRWSLPEGGLPLREVGSRSIELIPSIRTRIPGG